MQLKLNNQTKEIKQKNNKQFMKNLVSLNYKWPTLPCVSIAVALGANISPDEQPGPNVIKLFTAVIYEFS